MTPSSNRALTRRASSADPARRTRKRVAVPTVWTRAVSQFVTRAEHLGVPRASLLQHAGLSEDDLHDPDSRVPLSNCYAVLESALALSGDPLLHMRMSRSFELESLDVLAFVVMTSATLRAGIRAMVRYQRLWSDGEIYRFTEADGWGRLSYEPWGPARTGHGLMSEVFAVDVVVNGARMIDRPFSAPRVLLRRGAPDDMAAHRELLGGVTAAFEQARDEVWIGSEDLDQRLAPEGREAVCSFFERNLDDRIRALPHSLVSNVRDLLLRDLRKYDDLATVARALRMSARTLQRRLAADGSSLRALADDVRRARAIALIESGSSIAEIAWLLGLSDPSVLHRVFRRWTGMTPDAYRRKLRLQSSPRCP